MKTVKNESAKTSKIPKPFIAPGSTIKPTAEEIYSRKVKIKRAEEIGASITRVTDEEEVENPSKKAVAKSKADTTKDNLLCT